MNKHIFFWDRFNNSHDLLMGGMKLSKDVIQATPSILLVDLLIEGIYAFPAHTYWCCIRGTILYTSVVPIKKKLFPSNQVCEDIFH